MIRAAHAAVAALAALAAACSAPEQTDPSPVTADETRALAEARAMIPADEIDPPPTPEETPRP